MEYINAERSIALTIKNKTFVLGDAFTNFSSAFFISFFMIRYLILNIS